MPKIFRIELLPARDGDCIWIEYGDAAKPYRILIDGGHEDTWEGALKTRLEALPKKERVFELGGVTHIDGDHISGFLAMANQMPEGMKFRDFWFNGYKHLLGPDAVEFRTAKEGEDLSALAEKQGWSWNGKWDEKSVVVPDGDGPLPTRELVGGMKLTLLSPTWEALRICARSGRPC